MFSPQNSSRARYRSVAFASVAVLSIALNTACSASAPKEADATTSSPATVTAPASSSGGASAKPSESVKPNPKLDAKIVKAIKDLEAQGIELGEPVNIDGGSYPSYVVTAKSKLGKFNAAVHTGGTPKGWSKKDQDVSALKAANFFMNTVLNPPTRTEYNSNISPLVDSFDEYVLPERREEFTANAQSNESTGFTKDIFEPEGNYVGYTLINDGQTPRLKDVKIKISESQNWDGGVYYVFKGTYVLSAINEKTRKPRDLDSIIEYGVTVQKGDDGKMYVGGTQEIDEQYKDIQ